MDDRERELRELADWLCEKEAIVDAWTAKSFTDRLFIVEVECDTDLSSDIRQRLLDHGLQGYNEVHDVSATDEAFAGELQRGDRYQFVDVRERGALQSYVVE